MASLSATSISAEQFEVYRKEHASLLTAAQHHLSLLMRLVGEYQCASGIATADAVLLHVAGAPSLTDARRWKPGVRLLDDDYAPQCLARGGCVVAGESRHPDVLVPIAGGHDSLAAILAFTCDGDADVAVGPALLCVAQALSAALQLHEFRRDHERIISAIGHELRQPLSALVTAMELFKRMPGELPGHPFHVARRQVMQLSRLVDSLLDMSRILTGKLRIRHQVVELRTIVAAAVESVRTDATTKHQEISTDLGAAPIWCIGDVARVQQVVTNLLVNAVRYTPQNGCVIVTSREEGADAVVQVADNGPGFDPRDVERIFRPFMPRSTTSQGLGLGLPISRGIVEALGGSLTALTDGPGRGATFTVRLPNVSQRTRDLRDTLARTRQQTLNLVERSRMLRTALGPSHRRRA
jgi:signal transduction histidine kinase